MSNGIEDFDTSAFMDEFVQEIGERLEAITAGLLQMEEESGNSEVLHDVFRAAHSIKGAAKIMGLETIAQVAHHMEDVLESLDRHRGSMTPRLNDLLLRGVDAIRVHTAAAERSETADLPVDDLCQALMAVAGIGESGAPLSPETAPTETLPEEPAATAATGVVPPLTADTVRVNVSQIDDLVSISTELVMAGLRSQQYLDNLAELGSQLRRLSREISTVRRQQSMAQLERTDPLAGHAAKLTALYRQVNELELSYEQHLDSIGDLIEQLEEKALSMRLLPMSTLFSGLPRAVRDLARQRGKEVRLTLEGGETSLDKAIIAGLSSPLVHLLRNAVDHGIEPPADRLNVGKPAVGNIWVSAQPAGDRVRVTIEDDGRGMEPAAIKAKAVEKGIISAAEADTMTDSQTRNLIFWDGFSTSETLTDTSGRGVGMSAARRQVEQMRGTLQAHSTPGQGTRFDLDFPPSLSALHVLLVESSGQMWAIPSLAIVATTLVSRPAIRTVDGRLTLQYRDRVIPLAPLDALLGSGVGAWPANGDGTPIVVIGHPEVVAIGVDRLLDEREIIAKSLGPFLVGLPKVAGATILGDGRVVIILDTLNLAKEVPRWHP